MHGEAPLDQLPEERLPPGYTIRSIGVDEGHYWEAVMDQSFGGYAPGSFHEVMVMNYDYDPERVRVMFDDRRLPCATATSWQQPYRWGEGTGYVLFVAVARAYQGRGLGAQMTLHVLRDFVKHGFERAILETEDQRLAALKTYLKLGFKPRIVHPNQYERWERIYAALGMEAVKYSHEIRPRRTRPTRRGPGTMN